MSGDLRSTAEGKTVKEFKVGNSVLGCILIDSNAKRFVALPSTSDSFFGNSKIITSIEQIKEKNPDIIDFSQVERVDIKVKTVANKIKKNENGQQISYNPKHYEYMCNFEVDMLLNHPVVKNIQIKLNDSALRIPCNEPRRIIEDIEEVEMALFEIDKEEFCKEYNLDYRKMRALENWIHSPEVELQEYLFGFKVDEHRNWDKIQKYENYLKTCMQIKNIIEGRIN